MNTGGGRHEGFTLPHVVNLSLPDGADPGSNPGRAESLIRLTNQNGCAKLAGLDAIRAPDAGLICARCAGGAHGYDQL